MKYIYFFALIALQYSVGNAQSLKLPVGKKFTVYSNTSNLVEVTMMDNHMQMHNDGTVQTLYELTAVTNTGYTMQVTPMRMNYVIVMNGMEQRIDTDNPTDKANPMFAQVMDIINHPQIIEVENEKIVKNSKLAVLNQTGLQEDNRKLFLTVPNSNLHIGYQWMDSTKSEAFNMMNQFIVMQLTDSTVNVHVKSDFSIQNNVEQAGLKMLQNLKGFSSGDRAYNRINGLLKEENLEIDISGSTETQEMSSPITMKLKVKTKVEEEDKR